MTARQKNQNDYWNELSKHLKNPGFPINWIPKDYPEQWRTIKILSPDITLQAIVTKNSHRIEIRFKGGGKLLFPKLKAVCEADTLSKFPGIKWEEMSDLLSKISLKNNNGGLDERSGWDEQHRWFQNNLKTLMEFFTSKLEERN